MSCSCSGRPLEDDDLRGGATLSWHDRALRAGRTHGWRRLCGLRARDADANLDGRRIVVMDNLPSHKVKGVRELVEATGATLQ